MELFRFFLEVVLIVGIIYYKKDSDKMLEENQHILKHWDKIKERK